MRIRAEMLLNPLNIATRHSALNMIFQRIDFNIGYWQVHWLFLYSKVRI